MLCKINSKAICKILLIIQKYNIVSKTLLSVYLDAVNC